MTQRSNKKTESFFIHFSLEAVPGEAGSAPRRPPTDEKTTGTMAPAALAAAAVDAQFAHDHHLSCDNIRLVDGGYRVATSRASHTVRGAPL